MAISINIHKACLGIWHKKHGLVGSAAWGKDTSDSAFISYWVAPAFQRHGYGRQAITQLVRQLKLQGFHQILADVYFDSLPSKSVLMNLGFRIEGTLEEYEEKPILRLMLEGDNQPHGLTPVSFHPLSSSCHFLTTNYRYCSRALQSYAHITNPPNQQCPDKLRAQVSIHITKHVPISNKLLQRA